MSDQLFPVPEEWKKRAFVTQAQYEAAYAESVKDPDGFWRKEAARLDWIKPFTKVNDVSWDPDKLLIKWFEDGALNVVGQLHRPPSGQTRQPDRDHLGRRRSRRIPSTSPIANCTRKSAASPMC